MMVQHAGLYTTCKLLVVHVCVCDDDVIIKATNNHKFHAESKMKNLSERPYFL